MAVGLNQTYRLIFSSIVIGFLLISANPKTTQIEREAPFGPITLGAADSLLAEMNLEEKIALCFALTSADSASLAFKPSGVVGAFANASLNSSSRLPALRIVDWSSLDSIVLPLPAIASWDSLYLAEDYGRSLGQYLNARGYSVLTGLSADILLDPGSPSALQALSSDPNQALELLQRLIDGLNQTGIHVIIGTFPGISNATRGFAHNAPVVFSKRNALNAREMLPFKGLINNGITGVMMANAFVPALDSGLNMMASSSVIMHEILRNKLGFQGMIWSDLSSLPDEQDMTVPPAVKSLLAGSDVVMIKDGLQRHIKSLKQQIDWGAFSLEALDNKCRRIIQAQLWSEQLRASTGDLEGKRKRLAFASRLGQSKALVCIKNERSALPIKQLDTTRLAVIKIGNVNPDLNALVDRYAPAQLYQFTASQLEGSLSEVQRSLSNRNLLIIIADENAAVHRRAFGMDEQLKRVIEELTSFKRSILVWNGPDLALAETTFGSTTEAIMIGHLANQWSDDLAIQAVFGGRAVQGLVRRRFLQKNLDIPAFNTQQIRLAYGSPEEVGIRTEDLSKIETIALSGIHEMAYPGCQVWFAKDSIVVYDRSFGYHTYEQQEPVRNTDLYDLASITKIAASVGALMRLTEERKFSLNHRLCDYLDDWVDTTEYKQLGMREILAHQAGLPAWIPFYAKTLSKGIPRYDVYSMASSETYPTQVARELYIRSGYSDQMFREIINTKLQSEKKYKYSDIGYYFTQRIIERLADTSLDAFVDASFYRPLGLTTMGYRPLEHFSKDRITPTEFDRNFRGQLIRGYVHDPGAAMLGGVGGHAGLFSNANDLGILMQMYLNGGSYGGTHFFSQDIIDDFVRCQFCDNDNRRGAGFDKPLTTGGNGPSCGCTDLGAFGHQGFTGTVTWADPAEDVVYVFLSNRVYPNANNKKLLELNIRTDIQQVFYDAIEKGKELANEDNS